MAILGALTIGRSGLIATGDALSITGNNIANVNTTGFKGSRADFADLLTSQNGGSTAGLGGRMAGASTSFTQGSIESTGRPTDLAIEGNGFFIVRDGEVRDGIEECDDGNGSETDACLSTCQNARCGDGLVQQDVEACDDGNR